MSTSVSDQMHAMRRINVAAQNIATMIATLQLLVSRSSTSGDFSHANAYTYLFLIERLEGIISCFPRKGIPNDPFSKNGLGVAGRPIAGTSLHDVWIRYGWFLFEQLFRRQTDVAFFAKLSPQCHARRPGIMEYGDRPQIHRLIADGTSTTRVVDSLRRLNLTDREWPFERQPHTESALHLLKASVRPLGAEQEGYCFNFLAEELQALKNEMNASFDKAGFSKADKAADLLDDLADILNDYDLSRGELIQIISGQKTTSDATLGPNEDRQAYLRLMCDDKLLCSEDCSQVQVVGSTIPPYVFRGRMRKTIYYMIQIMHQDKRLHFPTEELTTASQSSAGDVFQIFKGTKGRQHPAYDDEFIRHSGGGYYVLDLTPKSPVITPAM